MGIIVNDDFEVYHKYLWRCGLSESAGEETARAYIRRYANTQVHTLIFNVNAQFSSAPSQVMETVESRYYKKEIDGVPFDFPSTLHKGWYDQVVVKGLDLWKIFVDEARACGISPWLSFRPNDTHDNLEPGGGLRQSNYTYTARREGRSRCTHRAVTGYYDNCLNYGLKEVQEKFLSYVEEQLLRYDVDGIEIDFLREAFLFRPGYEDEGAQIIHDMMQKIRALTKAAAERYGHALRLSLRTYRDPESDFYAGIRAPSLAKEGLIDAVTVSPRWETTDGDIPIEHWRAALPENIKLSIASELHYRAENRADKFSPPQLLRGLANYALSAGADDFYMFNFSYLAPPTGEGLPHLPHALPYLALLKEAGSLDTLKPLARRNMISYNDQTACGMRRRPTLPIEVSARHELSVVRVFTGPLPEKAYLLLDIDTTWENLSVYMNASSLRYLGTTVIEEEYASRPVYVFEADSFRPVKQIVEVGVKDKETYTLRYVEIRTERPALSACAQ